MFALAAASGLDRLLPPSASADKITESGLGEEVEELEAAASFSARYAAMCTAASDGLRTVITAAKADLASEATRVLNGAAADAVVAASTAISASAGSISLTAAVAAAAGAARGVVEGAVVRAVDILDAGDLDPSYIAAATASYTAAAVATAFASKALEARSQHTHGGKVLVDTQSASDVGGSESGVTLCIRCVLYPCRGIPGCFLLLCVILWYCVV